MPAGPVGVVPRKRPTKPRSKKPGKPKTDTKATASRQRRFWVPPAVPKITKVMSQGKVTPKPVTKRSVWSPEDTPAPSIYKEGTQEPLPALSRRERIEAQKPENIRDEIRYVRLTEGGIGAGYSRVAMQWFGTYRIKAKIEQVIRLNGEQGPWRVTGDGTVHYVTANKAGTDAQGQPEAAGGFCATCSDDRCVWVGIVLGFLNAEWVDEYVMRKANGGLPF